MNLKKNLLRVIAVILFAIFIIAQTEGVYAQVKEQAVCMGIIPIMTDSEPHMGYSIHKPGEENASKIWNIVKYPNGDGNYKEADIYCLRAGVGFTNEQPGVGAGQEQKQDYNNYYNMLTERETIKTQNILTLNGQDDSKYNEILALLDRLYLPEKDSDDKERKELILKIIKLAAFDQHYQSNAELIAQAFELGEEELGDLLVKDSAAEYKLTDYALTKNEISAIQQAAIWYFTNYDNAGKYDMTTKYNWLHYCTEEDSENDDYKSLSDYHSNTVSQRPDEVGQARTYQAEILYNYLINEAKKNASGYGTSSSGAPIEISDTVLKREVDTNGQYCIVGPINIKKLNSRPYTLKLEVKNGENTVFYSLLNKDKQAEETLENLINGENFYIRVSREQANNLSIKIDASYNDTTMTLWTTENHDSVQPLVELDKENKTITKTLNLQPDDSFDLALRKYITKVNDKTLEELTQTSRVPNIETSNLQSGSATTATYKHKKDPVTIKTGDKVTYEITIYNEGQKNGRATEIIDQLPTGLKFLGVVGDKYTAVYNETNNKVTLTLKDNSEASNLPAYTEGNLVNNGTGTETIEIECEVIETPDTKTAKVLTNVAWISKEADETGEITTEVGRDRDSEPSTTPNAKNGQTLNKDNMSDYTGNNSNKQDLTDKDFYYEGQQDDDDFEKLVLLPEAFDLKLIKFVTSVNSQNVPNRIEDIDVSKLNTLDANGNMITTADYDLDKDPVPVKKGDIVTYTFRIYNEGTINGYAEEITEDVPEGLEFIWTNKTEAELQADTSYTEEEKKAIILNQKYLWGDFKYDAPGGKIIQVSSNYLSRANNQTGNLIEAFGRNDGNKQLTDLKYKEIQVAFKVVSNDFSGNAIRNEAAITEDADSEGNPIPDRDSDTEDWKKYEDDEDYDQVVLQSFDLALRKFIIAVSKDGTIENSEYLKNTDGSYTRAPQVDTSKLNTKDESGKMITTATYNHTKEPVEVEQGDMVVYMLRVYNEGDIDGIAGEIKDHLPSNLEFVDNEYNKQYGWTVSQDGRTVSTTYLKDTVIAKAKVNEDGTIVLSYAEVPIMCHVSNEAKTDEKITNIADITEYLDKDKKPVEDRDSTEDNVELPTDDKLPEYKDEEKGPYVPGQEDDDDFEKVVIKTFDLALRKFITKIEDRIVDSRIPQVNYDKENDQITYQHGKDPLTVATGNVVEYTIRVFNEGQRNGYAAQIMDDIPEGLKFLPDNAVNKEYRWEMYRKAKEGENLGTVVMQDGETYVQTNDPDEAEIIVTDYLSKEQGEKNLLKAFDRNAEISDTNPDHKDVKVAFEVTEPNSSDKVIVNSAQISNDTDENGNEVEDKDSTPGEWNDGEDDQDKEYIELKEFDLALRKWVTQAIVIDNGKQTVTQTGHKPSDNPEQVVKVEIVQSKLNKVTVKFRYSIRVTNEGDIEGYAKEVTDYIPQGLKFVAADNPGWTEKGNNMIATRALENTLLQPGQYADVEVVLTWINSESGIGTVLDNWAEISEDDNPYDIPDKDSTPNNRKEKEDDIDDAPVILSIKTGQIRIYFTLGFIILITIAGGIILIKKYVL